ncbi:MAG: tetratricopeptide repeat protein [Burkholderiales bacterium]|nr:tetratricopeptide repeat protein [Burkholderiales bacterium]
MFRKSAIVLAAAVLLGGPAFADDSPSLHQVYQAAQSGRLDEAQKMMTRVLQEHPNSAKAHFVEAEILAKEGRTGNAATELETAQRLEPGLPFAKPEAVQELRTLIGGSRQPVGAHSQQAGFPWGMFFLGIGAITVIYLIFRSMAARRPAYVPAGAQPFPGSSFGPGGAPYGAGGYGPGYGPAPMGGGMGSGILSGLATGAALGAGMVAGEELAHHFMDGNSGNNMSPVSDSWNSSDNMGGQDFGIADNSSWNDGSSFADNSDFGGGDWS